MTARRIACIGVGTVGRSWAVVFARAGYDVALWDAVPAAIGAALPLIAKSVADLHSFGLLENVAETLSHVHAAGSLADTVADVVYIQESAAEDVAVKQALFAELDRLASADAIIASSTSAIPGSAFLEHIAGRHRCVIAHPVNPPHLIPLVEICASPWTDAATVEAARDLQAAVGQSPVILHKEMPGFLLNRLQWALLGEALHLVGEGVCAPDDIDRVLTQGLALRWAFIGPFEVGHLNAARGLKGYFDVLGDAIARVQHSLRTDYPPDARTVAIAHEAMARRIPVDSIPERQAWRDRRLMALRRHLAKAE